MVGVHCPFGCAILNIAIKSQNQIGSFNMTWKTELILPIKFAFKYILRFANMFFTIEFFSLFSFFFELPNRWQFNQIIFHPGKY